jgi:hypothetical protein
MHSLDDVKAGLRGAHPMRVGAAPVGECLTNVIVLLLAEAQGCEGDIVIGRGMDVMGVAAGDRSEAEVLCIDGQRIGSVAPVGVVDGGVELVIVAAPFRFSEAGVSAECYPVCDRANQRVFIGA